MNFKTTTNHLRYCQTRHEKLRYGAVTLSVFVIVYKISNKKLPKNFLGAKMKFLNLARIAKTAFAPARIQPPYSHAVQIGKHLLFLLKDFRKTHDNFLQEIQFYEPNVPKSHLRQSNPTRSKLL